MIIPPPKVLEKNKVDRLKKGNLEFEKHRKIYILHNLENFESFEFVLGPAIEPIDWIFRKSV